MLEDVKPMDAVAPEALDLPKTEMSPGEALERIRPGETVEDVRVKRLVLRGEFPLPVCLRNVWLSQPVFEGATFHGTVTLHQCTLDRPHFNKKNLFANGLDLSGATLNKAHFRNLTVQGPFNCEHM